MADAGKALSGIGQALTGTSNTLLNLERLKQEKAVRDQNLEINKQRLEAGRDKKAFDFLNLALKSGTKAGTKKILSTGRGALATERLFGKAMVGDDLDVWLNTDAYEKTQQVSTLVAEALKNNETDVVSYVVNRLKQTGGDVEGVIAAVDDSLKRFQTVATLKKTEAVTKSTEAAAKEAPREKQRRDVITTSLKKMIDSGQLKVDPLSGQVTRGQRVDQIFRKLNLALKVAGHPPIDASPEVLQELIGVAQEQFKAGQAGLTATQKSRLGEQPPSVEGINPPASGKNKVAQSEDGKFFLVKPDGTVIRPLTAQEASQVNAQ